MSASSITVMLIAGVFLWRNDPAPQEPVQYVQLTNFADSATQPALSPDGRMMAFVRGPETFMGPGQIYVKILPSGDPVQLTHDDMLKMSPRFSTDGTRIAYSTLNSVSGGWETWVVPVLGGQEPRLLLANAEGLTRIQEKTQNQATEPRPDLASASAWWNSIRTRCGAVAKSETVPRRGSICGL